MAGMMLGLGGDIGMGLLAGGNRPSYFELFMQGAISDMLRPAMQHVVAALAPRFPLLYRSARWHDEIFVALLGVLEWAHLRTKESTFAESFFGLKRVRYFPPTARNETPPPNWLRPVDQVGSMFFQLGVPYVKWKIEGWVAAQGGGTGAVADLGLGDDSSEEEPDSGVALRSERRSFGATLRRAFLRLWPVINFSYEALQFTYQFLYLVERTDWYSPGLQILRLRLERLGDDDRDRMEALSAAVPGWRKTLNRVGDKHFPLAQSISHTYLRSPCGAGPHGGGLGRDPRDEVRSVVLLSPGRHPSQRCALP
eukprot:COSAG03_NODE_489_length_7480_cov_26.899878_1_plen_310_part_00